jgi:hypothetical protein
MGPVLGASELQKHLFRCAAHGAFPIVGELREGHLLRLFFIAVSTYRAYPHIVQICVHGSNIVHVAVLVKNSQVKGDSSRDWARRIRVSRGAAEIG